MLATVPLAILIPALFGILLAGPIVHLRGDYLLVVTIGFNIVFVQVVQNNLGGITGGPNGIFGLDPMSFFGFQLANQLSVYYFAFVVLLLTLWIMRNLEKSKAGRALHYLREDQLAAESIGINTRVFKIFAFGLGAGIAGMAGTVYATQYAAVSPEGFRIHPVGTVLQHCAGRRLFAAGGLARGLCHVRAAGDFPRVRHLALLCLWFRHDRGDDPAAARHLAGKLR